MATETDIAYVAGQIDADGEGSTGVFFNGRSTYFVKTQIGQNTKAPLDFIYRRYGGIWTTRENRSGTFYMLNLNGVAGRPFLEDILPYLIVKRTLVMHVLQFFTIPNNERAELFEKVRTINALRGRVNIEQADAIFVPKTEEELGGE